LSTTVGSVGVTVAERDTGVLTLGDLRVIHSQVLLSLFALFVAVIFGLAQALDRVKVDLYPYLPGFGEYYQGLTAHGVLNALVFTFAFSNGFMALVVGRSLGVRPNPIVLRASAALIYAGTALAVWQIAAKNATVLFTMYAPLQASSIYYIGIALALVSTWATALLTFLAYRTWRRHHPHGHTPLQAYMVVATYAMWMIASLGVAVEVLVFLLPWSAGLTEKVDPQITRTLFWLSGHPIVYFWLLPAYVSWYTMIPAQTGGKLFSDPLARLVFLMFLVLSTPTGFHHQFEDPGISVVVKVIHGILTFAVFFPSMATAFSVVAALEIAGRHRGGTGLFGWIPKLSWGDPSFSAQIAAMLGFVFGGISGLINASYTVNMVVHNTSWVPGHFHLTIGTAVALSFMGISYWLVPHLSGRMLVGRRVAVAQSWLWLLGVLTFARGQIEAGLEGQPRRLWVSKTTYAIEAWDPGNLMTAIGGTIMFVSAMMFFAVIVPTLVAGRRGPVPTMPVTKTIAKASEEWPLLERWGLWIGIAVFLVAIAYGPFFLNYYPLHEVAPGYRVW
jgi:cytochrome c oxidase subunit 1